MSDGFLSQEELNVLMNGHKGKEGDGSSSLAVKTVLSELRAGIDKLEGMFDGKKMTIDITRSEALGVEGLKARLPEKPVLLQGDLTGEPEGQHGYWLTTEDAGKMIPSLLGQDDADLDESSVSALTEFYAGVGDSLIRALRARGAAKAELAEITGSLPEKEGVSFKGEGQFILQEYLLEIGDIGRIVFHEYGEAKLYEPFLNNQGAGAPAAGEGSSSTGKWSPGVQNVQNVQNVEFPNFIPGNIPENQRNIGLLMDVSMNLTVELGRTRWQIRDILMMGEGTIVELDKLAGEPVDILVNHNLIARGEVVVIDENFAVRVTEIVSTLDRLKSEK